MLTKILGANYVDLLNSGIKNLDRHRSILNDLNVFPVPDGDTGTNMCFTMRGAVKGVNSTNGSFLNGRRLPDHAIRLKDSDKLSFGNISFIFVDNLEAES